MDAPLRGRAQEILHSIVRAYIETGEPVGSRLISKRRNDALSAASIRNVMMDLAEQGYLAQPHTSAGRIPTEKAFRDYVTSLAATRMQSSDAGRLRAELGELATLEARVERSSQILSKLTRNVGIAAAISVSGQALDQIELLPLSDKRVLMILATQDHMVRNKVITLLENLSADELAGIRNYINRNFHGWRLDEARRELLRRIAEESAAFDAMLKKIELLCEKGLLETQDGPEIHMDGASNLVGLDLHLTRETMRDLLHALEEKKRLVELLDRFLEQPTGELDVHIGLGEAHPAMSELALIGITYHLPGGLTAQIAVIGPMRMHYERVMGAVFHLGRAFQAAHIGD